MAAQGRRAMHGLTGPPARKEWVASRVPNAAHRNPAGPRAVPHPTSGMMTVEMATVEMATGEMVKGVIVVDPASRLSARRLSTSQNQTGQSQTGQSQTGQSQTGDGQTGQSQTGQSRTGQDQMGQDQMGQDRTGRNGTSQRVTNPSVRTVEMSSRHGLIAVTGPNSLITKPEKVASHRTSLVRQNRASRQSHRNPHGRIALPSPVLAI